MPGTLFVVATPIGNLEDITLRALRILREVSLIAAEDTRRTGHLLARHAIATPTTSLHEHNEVRKSPAIVARLLGGESVALVSDAGTPGISDPGAHLVKAARNAGVRVEPIPGPSSVMALLSVSGLSTKEFSFAGFPPTRSKDRKSWLARVAQMPVPVVFFEAPHRVISTISELEAVVGADRVVIIGRELTKTHEQLVVSPISAVLARLGEPRGEFVLIVTVGETTKSGNREIMDRRQMIAEVGRLTNSGQYTRRQAIAAVAKQHGLATNAVYKVIEESKNLVD